MKWILFTYGLLFFSACKFEKAPQPDGDYPPEIASLFQASCSVQGCHNAQSNINAAGLDLSSWERLFQGSRSGAAIVPYSASESFLLNFVNTYADLGPVQSPQMPPNEAPLTREQVVSLRQWILSGAPDKNGKIPFTQVPGRKKIYVVNQGCDLLSVIDQSSGLLMRSLEVGISPVNESPHNVRIRPDGKRGYIVFLNAGFVQYFDTETDQILGEIQIGHGQWNTLAFSPDGKYAFAADFNPNGKIACIRLEDHTLLQMYQGSGFLINPHGQAISPEGNILWVAPQTGNFIYRLDISDPRNPTKLSSVILDESGTEQTGSLLDPHEIMFSPDGKYLFATCQKTNELRVINTSTGLLEKIIPVGIFPQEMDISKSNEYPYVWVTCMEDSLTYPGMGRGSVWVINWKTLEIAYFFYAGYQPHGIGVMEEGREVWVANRNLSTEGLAPHHTSVCEGRPGYANRFHMADGKQINTYPIWLSVDPYGLCVSN